MGVSVEYRFEQRRADALSLFFGIHQNILHKYHRGAVADHADEPQQRVLLIGRQEQQGVLKAMLQRGHVLCICRPANLRIERKNFICSEFCIFLYFHAILLPFLHRVYSPPAIFSSVSARMAFRSAVR